MQLATYHYWRLSGAFNGWLSAYRLRQEGKRNRLTSFLRPHHLHRHPLGLVQGMQACTLDDGDVDKHVLLAILAGHEPEALICIEPFDGPLDIDSACRISPRSAR